MGTSKQDADIVLTTNGNPRKATKPRKRRRKGSGSILKRRGYYVIRWRDDDGTHQETTDFRVGSKGAKEAAEALLEDRGKIGKLQERRDQVAVLIAEREELTAKIERLRELAKPGPAPLTLGGLVEAWRKSPRRKDCKPEQLAVYARQIGDFVEWAGREVEMRDVGDDLAERYAAHLGGRVSGSTYNKHLNALTAAWKAVGRAAGVQGNVWADLPRKRLEAHCRRALTAEEVEKVIGTAEGELRDLLTIGVRTGLRMGDACRLRWDAISADGQTVEVVTGKTGATVRLPAAALLRDLGRREDSGYIVPGMAATYERDPATVSKAVRKLFERAGLVANVKEAGWLKARADASFHSLRHTFVTRAIESGVPAAIVRALVGHSREAMTEHYSHISAAAVLEAFSKAQ